MAGTILDVLSRTRVLAALAALTVALAVAFWLLERELVAHAGVGSLDRMGFSRPGTVRKALAAHADVPVHATIRRIDRVFPTVHAALLAGMTWRLWPDRRLVLLPLAAMVCDHVENGLLATLAARNPDFPDALARAAGAATALKGVLVACACLAVAAGLGRRLADAG